MNDQQTKQGPAMKFKGGSIEAAIFENQKDGKTWHNVSIIRRYRNRDGAYRSTSTYAYADLVQVARIAEQAESGLPPGSRRSARSLCRPPRTTMQPQEATMTSNNLVIFTYTRGRLWRTVF